VAALLATTAPGAALASATPALADTGQGLVPQSVALAQPSQPDPSTLPLPPAPELPAGVQAALGQARVQAMSTGRSVLVPSMTTETSTTSVLPSGHTQYTTSVLPVRVKRGNGWVPIDTRLQRTTAGGFAPAAAPAQVEFSGGGNRPLVTMTASGGASLALTWPTALPVPSVSGSTLTYASVFPSVDLKVTATQVGGFTETLVIKTAAAAANPALGTLRLGTHAHGLKVVADTYGNLSAVAPDGAVLFHAPAPQMWDSSTSTPATGVHALAAVAAAHPAIASTETVAGTGARIAPVRAQLTSTGIRLTPNQALLKSRSVHYPLFVDPTWTAQPQTGSRQHFDEVQQGCPGAQNFDSTTYGNPGVGDNTFSGCIGIERTYYQLSVPSQIYGADAIDSATFNIQETYSASCSASSTINLAWTGAINQYTDWNSAQSLMWSQQASASIGPACTSWPSTGFNIKSLITTAAAQRWTNITFGVGNSNESDGTYFKRFSINPTFTVTYDHKPDQPTAWDAKAKSTDLGCATTAPYPALGLMDSTTSVVLSNKVTDPDSDSTQTAYQYWVDGSTTKSTLYSINGVASGGTAMASPGIPASFTNPLTDGTVVDWQIVWVGDGNLYTYPPSSTVCHFTVYAHSQPIQLSSPAPVAEDTAVSVTATSSSTDPAVKYVYALDTTPPASNPPASQTLSGSQVSGGTATITTVALGAGRHMLYVNGYDAGGNVSKTSVPIQVTAASGHTYGSLSDAFNNTAVSDQSKTSNADMDGGGNSLSLQDLQAAGWASSTTGQGTQVTIDGATISLPAYGSGHDNVLADNQTITFPGGTSGDALVILATSANAGYSNPKDVVGSGSITSPHTPVNTGFAGSGCTLASVSQTDCSAPTGTLTYSNDNTTANYQLVVPDWATGQPSGLSVVTLPHYNRASAANQTGSRYLYAFAIHLKPGATLGSVTLPDVSGPANPGTTPAADPRNIAGNPLGSPLYGVPALHILGWGVRHATTDTAGRTWTGAWSAPAENQYAYTGNTHFTQQTFRTALTPSVSGTGVRVHVSNQQSNTPLTLTHLTVAPQVGNIADSARTTAGGNTITTPGFSPVPAGTPVAATFGGQTSVTIPAGGDLYSDPITTMTVTAGSPLLVSASVADAPTVEGHLWATDAKTWITAKNAGDTTGDTTGAPFTATGNLNGDWVNIFSGLDTITTGNQPTVAVLGDGLYTPYATGSTAQSTAAGPRLSDALAAALGNQSTLPHYGIVNTGIENNSLTIDVGGNQGHSALSRIDRDILSEPGLTTVVIDQGLADTLNTTLDTNTISTAYVNLQSQLQAWGIKTVYTTMTPCGGNSGCTTTADAIRTSLNNTMTATWLSRTAGLQDYVSTENSDAALSANTAASPETLKTTDPGGSFDSGDHINLTPYASATMALPANFTLSDLVPGLVPGPATPPLSLQEHWGLADGTGTTAADSSPNGNNLPLVNPVWQTDSTLPTADTSQQSSNPTGKDLSFDGSTSYGLATVPMVTTNQNYAVDAWVKLTSLTATDQVVVNETAASANALTLGYSGATQHWTLTTLTADTTPAVKSIDGGAASAGVWTHLRAVYDQSTSTLTLYVNGAVAGTVTNSNPLYDTTGTNSNFSIGAIVPTGTTTPTSVLQGALSDITLSA
jgi:hypothetical protein